MKIISNKYDVIIIGGGPAGLSSAIYTSRANFDTLVLDKKSAKLEKAETIQNFLGFPNGISGKELLNRGRKQAKNFDTEINYEEVLIIKMQDDDYSVQTAKNEYLAKSLILAPGIERKKPPLEDLEKFEGKGISYCVTCDGPFYKDKKVGILGSKDYAAKETLELLEYTKNITIFTNGKDLKIKDNLEKKIKEKNIPVIKKEIREIKGKDSFSGLVLEDEIIELDGLFIAIGTSGSADFAKTLGIPTEGEKIMVDEDLSTGIPRVYAAGDCTPGPQQLSVAMGEGAKAALNLIKELKGTEYIDWKAT